MDAQQHDFNVAVAAFERTHADWDDMIRSVGLDRMDEPGVMGQWSTKQLIAHLAGWQWKTVESFKKSLSGGEYPATPWPAEWNDPATWEADGQVEPINQWIHDRAAGMSSDEVIQEARDLWLELRRIVGGLSVDQMNDPNLFPRLEGKSLGELLLAGEFMGHFREHLDEDVLPWLQANGKRL
jgi:hypothetical protein